MAKVLSAAQILSVMGKATPANALRLTDPELYKKVDYQEFFSVIPKLGFNSQINKRLSDLQDEIAVLNLNKDNYYFREDKIYIYFILSLQEILNDPN